MNRKTIQFAIFSAALFFFSNNVKAATEFISVIDPGGSSVSDFSSVASWESTMTNTATDLTSANTKVFSGTITGSIADNVTVYQCRGTTYQNVSGTMVYDTKAGQALVKGITGGASFSANDFWNTSSTCTGATNYFTISNTGDSAIAVAKCRTTNGAADTTAVAIDGWTTSATNYIKVWTDPAENYRHSGRWDNNKYRLEINDSENFALNIGEEYARIDGLQVRLLAIDMVGIGTGYIEGDIRISNNIVAGVNLDSTLNGSIGILSDAAGAGLRFIWNNIVYEVATDNGICIGTTGGGSHEHYIYNNTCTRTEYGFYNLNGYIIAKNNIAQDNYEGDYYSSGGTVDPAFTNNITDFSAEDIAGGVSADSGNTDGIGSDANVLRDTGQNFLTTIKVGMIVANTTDATYSYVTAVGSDTQLTLANDIMDDSEDYTVYTNMFGNVVFADEASNDYHLDSADTVARNKGAILYDSGDDSNLNFTTDIDNNGRLDSATAWDVGADESIAKIYRSIGPGATTAIASGGSANYGNLEVKPSYLSGSSTNIVDYVATFWRPLPDGVGVGDAIQYDDDGDEDIDANDSIVFITRRIDSTHYSVRTASGAAPASTVEPDADWSVFRAYASLTNAEAGTENSGIDGDLSAFDGGNRDMVTNEEQWNLACYANGTSADTSTSTNIIDGWTTGASSYLRIYTPTGSDEVGTTQRHAGKWDDNKYHVQPAASNGFAVIGIREEYVRLEGLQVRVVEAQSSDFDSLIYTNSGTTFSGADIRISDNILKSITNNSINYPAGMVIGTAAGSTGTVKLWNNIIYDVKSTGNNGVGIWFDPVDGFTVYAYNNTVQNADYGYGKYDSGTIALKNNIAQDCTDGYYLYSGSWDSSSDYNLSDVATDAPGSNSRNNVSATFFDETNDDFHLAPSDTNAKNYGADLTNDASIFFNTDVDSSSCTSISDVGNRLAPDTCTTRPRGTDWDIGADELLTKIYRSVAYDSDANMPAIDNDNSQADTLTISSAGVATFEVAVADIVGVGDALVYDDDADNDLDANDSVVFIHGRTDSTHYTVRDADGSLPDTTTTDNDKWGLYRVYNSLYDAEYGYVNAAIPVTIDGGNVDLQSSGQQWNLACYGNGTTADSDTGTVTISGWTTTPTNYLRIYTPVSSAEVGVSQRHQGKWNDYAYKITSPSSSVIVVADDFVRIDGLQIDVDDTASNYDLGLEVNGAGADGDVRLTSNIVRGEGTGSGETEFIGMKSWANDSTTRVLFANNIMYGFYGGSGAEACLWLSDSAAGMVKIYNNTAYDCTTGFDVDGGEVVAINNIAQDSADGFWGTFQSGSDYNISNVSSDAPGENSKNNVTVGFVDIAGDFHLAQTDTQAREAGKNLARDVSVPFTEDVNGHVRPGNGTGFNWDIGADEGAVAIYRSIAPSGTGYLDRGVDESGTDLSISGSTMTLENATADNVGVGDAVQYDSDGNDTLDALVFITARASGTSFTVKRRDGTAPAAVTNDQNWEIYRAYTTLDNAEGGVENSSLNDIVEHFDIDVSAGDGKNIYLANQQWNLAAYANGTTSDSTRVVISGWKTYAPNYFKVYTPYAATEVGTSQRHQGRWDTNKYHIDITIPASYLTIIGIKDEYVRLEGLQIGMNGTSAYQDFAVMVRTANTNDVRLSGNILRNTSGGSAQTNGIFCDSGQNIKIWNNIVYGFNTDVNSKGIEVSGWNSAIAYVYNNTAYGNYANIGQYHNTTVYAKNNIADTHTGGGDYVGSFDAESTNNLSSDATSPNSSLRNKNPLYSSEANRDLHLASADTAAKNAGANLSADAHLIVTSDIDTVHARNISLHTGAFDIGADEAASAIFYSVGQNTTSHETGAGTVTVDATARTATFSVAQTATNMGVGDVIDYDSDNKKCYITGKSTTSVWYCQSATGGAPTAATGATVNSVAHPFSSLLNAEDQADDAGYLNTSNLWTNNYQLNFPCYWDTGAETAGVTVDGYTTGVPNFIKLYTPTSTTTEANASQRHQGFWDALKYNIAPSLSGSVLLLADDHVKIEGIQIGFYNGAQGYHAGIFTNQYILDGIEITENIIRNMTPANNGAGIVFSGSDAEALKIRNNIIYDFTNTSSYGGIFLNLGSAYVYNNTVVNSYYGIRQSGGTVTLKNNITQDCTDGYNGTFSGSDYNLSDITGDTTGISASYRQGQITDVTFIKEYADDFHLSPSDQYARNNGTALSADSGHAFTNDVDSMQTRPSAGTWDIGADEAAIPVYYSVGQNTGNLETGSGTVSISGGVATFSTAQTANIGVGDKITYNTTNYAYISGKTDTSTWSVVTATGGTPGNVTDATVDSITHVFSTLALAEAGAEGANYLNTTDLLGSNYQLNIPCYYDSAADTSNLTISGWTTGVANYIKVYTPNSTTAEANASQRHSGKWDMGKFRMVYSGSNTVVDSNVSNVKIMGLQVNYGGSWQWANGIEAAGLSNVEIGYNIIDSVGSTDRYQGINATGGTSENKRVYNNIVISYDKGISTGSLSQPGAFVYNNTAAYCENAFDTAYLTTVVKNNIAQNSSSYGYAANMHSSSDYNLSDMANDAPSPSYRSNQATTVSFVDKPNKDYHLAVGDTMAREAGTALTSDAYLRFTDDIDGGTRPTQTNWDIGADEGSIGLYRSVGATATNLNTDSRTVTIAGATATFSDTMPNNVGVGDVLEYDPDGGGPGGYYLAFISARSSSTVYTLQSATGGTPQAASAGTAVGVYRAYPSQGGQDPLYNWEEQDENDTLDDSVENFDTSTDLITGNTNMNAACYGDAVDSTTVAIDGWTTSGGNYIKIYTPVASTEVGTSQRHSGVWDSAKYRRDILIVQDDYVYVDGIQFDYTGSGSSSAFSLYGVGGEVQLSNSILKRTGSDSDSAVYDDSSLTHTFKIWNNIIYDFSGDSGVSIARTAATVYIHNNTFYNLDYGIYKSAGTVIAKNNLIQNVSTAAISGAALDTGTTTNIVSTGGSSSAGGCDQAETGTTTSTSGYKLVDSTQNFLSTVKVGMIVRRNWNNTYTYVTSVDSNTQLTVADDYFPAGEGYVIYTNRVVTNIEFLDAAADDYHLKSTDTYARDNGVTLSTDAYLGFTTDADGQTRPYGPGWDIGADEGAVNLYRSVGVTATNLNTNNRTVTISGTTATFNNSMPDNVGVGDVLQYDPDGGGAGGYYLAFITARASSTVYTVASSTGIAPQAAGAGTAVSVYRAYTSQGGEGALYNWEELDENDTLNDTVENFDTSTDLPAANAVMNVACYGDGADTTAVSINGWTTSAGSYIRVYAPYSSSEAGTSQRHQGVWDETKYRIVVDDSPIIDILEQYVRIEGLQVHANGAWRYGISASAAQTATADIRISGNIIRGYGSDQNGNGIYYDGDADTYLRVHNNIVYDFQIGVSISDAPIYLYGNTIQNCATGVNNFWASPFLAKNNVVQDCTTCWTSSGGSFDAASTNNNSDDNTQPGSSGSNGEVAFLGESDDDFHLSQADSIAKNQGASLTGDTYLPFATDIDTSTRNSDSRGWDIGADETATVVYYSVGQDGTTDRKTGSPTVDISNGVATFSVAQTGNIGVGDVIDYGASQKAYITGKTSTLVWTVQTAVGANITGVDDATVNSIKRVFTSLSLAEAGASGSNYMNTADIISGNFQPNFPCYYDTEADATAVTINGWNTSATHYIKIYTPQSTATEANQSQRHNGAWSNDKYSLWTPWDAGYSLELLDSHIKIDGLQIGGDFYEWNYAAISTTEAGNYHWDISNSIFNTSSTNSAMPFGYISMQYDLDYNGSVVRIWNNVFYNYKGTNGTGIKLTPYTSGTLKYYIYNNTFRGLAYGIYFDFFGDVIAKNNLFKETGTPCSGTFAAGTDYNATDDSSMGYTVTGGGNTHDRLSQNFSLVDEPNYDYHLASSDTGALDSGVDLTTDGDLSISADIDSETRSGTWDIGADETTSATSLYRSVGATATNLNTDSRTVTIAGTTATFSDTMPNNVGVGDVLQYDPDGAGPGGYYLAFIYGRTSSTVYTVRSATGVAPQAASAGTAVGVYRAYTSQGGQGPLYNWEEQDENDTFDDTVEDFDTSTDLVANDTIMNAACYGDGADTTAVTIDGWTTGANNYIKVYTPYLPNEVGTSQRHSGKWDDGKYRLAMTNSHGITLGDSHIRIDGLQISLSTGSNRHAIREYLADTGTRFYFSNNIIKSDAATTSHMGISDNYGVGANAVTYVWNNIIYDFETTSDQTRGIYSNDADNSFYVYNNTIIGGYYGIDRSSSTVIAKNNLFKNNTVSAYGIFAAGTDYNATDDSAIGYTVAGGGNTNDRVSRNFSFLDAANFDFHLMETDDGAKDHGTNLSADPNLPFTDDIDGNARTGTWDIGAAEAYSSIKINGGVKINGGARVERQ